MEVIKELIIAFIVILILLSPFLIFMCIVVKIYNQITPCRIERDIEDILNYYKCFEPSKRKIIKNKLIYEYRYNNLDTHRALVRRFKKLDIELMEEK